MSLPDRSRVWSAPSDPGTAGSGICFTQTAMFIRLRRWECAGFRGAPTQRRRPPDDLILAAIGPSGRNVGTVEPLTGALQKEAPLDVLVVGAGPAGAAAGIEAHRYGLATTVVDKATFPRDKTCGDGLTTGALRLLDALGFDVRTLPSWTPITDTVLVSPSGREVEVALPPDGAYAGVAPRAELDAGLVDHARSRGVDIREGVGVTALHDHGDTVTVM